MNDEKINIWLNFPVISSGDVHRELPCQAGHLYYDWCVSRQIPGFTNTLFNSKQIRNSDHTNLKRPFSGRNATIRGRGSDNRLFSAASARGTSETKNRGVTKYSTLWTATTVSVSKHVFFLLLSTYQCNSFSSMYEKLLHPTRLKLDIFIYIKLPQNRLKLKIKT